MKPIIISLVLSLVLSVEVVCAEVYSGTCGDNLTWSLSTEDSTLTITGTGVMFDWSSSKYTIPWLSYKSYIKYLSLPEGLTSIEYATFYGCSNLLSVAIPNNVTSIGNYAFRECTSLTSVTIGNSVSSIGDYAFYGCSSLTFITIPDNVIYIGGMAFRDCTSLTSITIPNSVTSIGNSAFYGCISLTSVLIPNSVTSIGVYTFHGCTSLTSVNIPDNVTYIGDGAFYECTSLTSVAIPDNVTIISEEAFYNCSLLTSVVIGNSVITIRENAFYGCNNLTTVTLKSSIVEGSYSSNSNLSDVFGSQVQHYIIGDNIQRIGMYAFYNCNNLTSVTIGRSVTSIKENAFLGCNSLDEVHVSDITAWCNILFVNSEANPLFYAHNLYLNDELVTDMVIPEGVTNIGNYAFEYCNSLNSITIPSSATSIGNYAFSNCKSLTTITIPNNITNIGNYAFEYCTSLNSITIPSSATNIGNYAFSSCNSLTTLSIPNKNIKIGEFAFGYCTGLTSVTIPNKVTNIGNNAFYRVPNIVYNGTATGSPWGARSLNGYVDGWLVYSDDSKKLLLACSAVATEEIIIPESVISIGVFAFYGCNRLTSVTMPDSVINIGNYAFSGCSSLASMEIPNSVTNIGDYAFQNCNLLQTLTLGSAVSSIGTYAFSICSSLNEINAMMDLPPAISSNVFYGCGKLSDIDCNVLESSLSLYKAAEVWKKFNLNVIPTYTVSILINDNQMGIVYGNGTYLVGSYVVISATPNKGYSFVNWSDGTTTNPYTFILSQDTTITAYFEVQQPVNENDHYVILAQRNASSNWFYMTSDIGSASNKRYQAVDAATSVLANVTINNLDSKYYWEIEDNKLKSDIGYSTWSSGNTANFNETGIELTIEKQLDNTYTFSFTDGSDTRYLSLNSTAGNNYFAYYKGMNQIYKLTLIKEGESGITTNMEITTQQKPRPATKILRDGQILIIRGDKTYTITGAEVK